MNVLASVEKNLEYLLPHLLRKNVSTLDNQTLQNKGSFAVLTLSNRFFLVFSVRDGGQAHPYYGIHCIE